MNRPSILMSLCIESFKFLKYEYLTFPSFSAHLSVNRSTSVRTQQFRYLMSQKMTSFNLDTVEDVKLVNAHHQYEIKCIDN